MNAKKIIAIGVAAVSVSLFAENAVESSNVVGYMTVDRASKYQVGGNCFVVPGGTSWNLKDLKITGSDYESDYIQFVKTNGAIVDRAKSYYYDDDLESWCYLFSDSGKAGDPVEDEECVIPAGTAVLCVFNSSTAKLTYSGEVVAGNNGEISVARVGKYQFIANQLPYDVNVANLKISGGDYEADYIQFIKPTIAVVDRVKSFFYDEDVESMCYLFSDSGKAGEEVAEADNMMLKAGEGVLAVFNSATAKLVFPAPNL